MATFRDRWNPTQKELAEVTPLDKVKLMNEMIDLSCSDTQFAEKLKTVFAAIVKSYEPPVEPEEPPVEPPPEETAATQIFNPPVMGN